MKNYLNLLIFRLKTGSGIFQKGAPGKQKDKLRNQQYLIFVNQIIMKWKSLQ